MALSFLKFGLSFHKAWCKVLLDFQTSSQFMHAVLRSIGSLTVCCIWRCQVLARGFSHGRINSSWWDFKSHLAATRWSPLQYLYDVWIVICAWMEAAFWACLDFGLETGLLFYPNFVIGSFSLRYRSSLACIHQERLWRLVVLAVLLLVVLLVVLLVTSYLV